MREEDGLVGLEKERSETIGSESSQNVLYLCMKLSKINSLNKKLFKTFFVIHLFPCSLFSKPTYSKIKCNLHWPIKFETSKDSTVFGLLRVDSYSHSDRNTENITDSFKFLTQCIQPILGMDSFPLIVLETHTPV